MEKILSFNKFNFITENSDYLEFPVIGQGANYGGMIPPGFGLSVDPSMSIYSNDYSPFTDFYSRSAGLVANAVALSNLAMKTSPTYFYRDDAFAEDVELFKNLKILRISVNSSNLINVFISFVFNNIEFFGFYKDFNGLDEPKLSTELYSDPRFGYIEQEYKIKLNSYLYRALYNWFIPIKGFYYNLKDHNPVKDYFGQTSHIKKDKLVEVIGYNTDESNNPYIIIEYNSKKYFISGNNYYFFNYFFEKRNIK